MSSAALEFYSKEFDELSEVVRTVDIVHAGQRYRVEILKGYSNENIPFSAKCWIEEEVEVHPKWTEKGEQSEADAKKTINVLCEINLPWVNRDTADSALQQALGFLLERARQS